MEEYIQWKYVISSMLYSVIGIAIFALCYGVIDFLTPKTNLWEELSHKQNIALAIFLGAAMLGIAFIIGSAIHG
jgi:uncharacterized membrane protein YjfL (UPF0719 family)